jgi:hypothetical protein
VTQALATLLEFSQGPVVGPRGIIAGAGAVAKTRSLFQHGKHLLGIVLPVGGEVQNAPRSQFRPQRGDERSLDQAPLVMALLVPGIGEVDLDPVQ